MVRREGSTSVGKSGTSSVKNGRSGFGRSQGFGGDRAGSSPGMGLLGKVEIWELIEPVVQRLGYEIFDLDLPSRMAAQKGAALRLYIQVSKDGPAEPVPAELLAETEILGAPESLDEAGFAQDQDSDAQIQEVEARTGVSISDCALVSRAILNLPESEDILPGNTVLEVSSPGVNRRLSLRKHFEQAVGERIKVTFNEPAKGDSRSSDSRGRATSASRTVRGYLEGVEPVVKETRQISGAQQVVSGKSEVMSARARVYEQLYGSSTGWKLLVKPIEVKKASSKKIEANKKSEASAVEQLMNVEGLIELRGDLIIRAQVDFDFSRD